MQLRKYISTEFFQQINAYLPNDIIVLAKEARDNIHSLFWKFGRDFIKILFADGSSLFIDNDEILAYDDEGTEIKRRSFKKEICLAKKMYDFYLEHTGGYVPNIFLHEIIKQSSKVTSIQFYPQKFWLRIVFEDLSVITLERESVKYFNCNGSLSAYKTLDF